MTPERAAQVLGIATTASPAEISAAFAHQARLSHPDVDSGDAGRFRDVVEARTLLLSRAAEADAAAAAAARAAGETGDGRVYVTRHVDGPRIQGPWLIAGWVAILLVAAFLSIFRASYPLTVAEPLLRWALLIAAAVYFAQTARRPAMVVAILMIVATVAMTVLFATLGGLVGLLVMLPAILGLFTAGIARERMARAYHELHGG